MKLLIVDDSRTMRSILASYARPLGFTITEAMDGKDALEQIARHQPFDAVLIDWDMPVMNGLELLRILRANPSYAGWKLMMVTAQSSMSALTTAIEMGANDYLMKPLTEEMFQDKKRCLELVA
jgi:two-component system chemotaxis response regulator CheY